MADYDAIIIGGGPAGISALIWCASVGLRGLLLERAAELGGQLLLMHHPLPDYPGLLPRDGRELRDHFENHLRTLQLEWRTGCRIDSIRTNHRSVVCNGQTLTARALILAMGARKRWLNVPGESALIGRGVSDNATRDKELFAGREVCVIGGGDSAFEDAFLLAEVCPQVTLLHRSRDFRARRVWIQRVIDHPRIEIITDTDITAIQSDAEFSQVSGVQVRHRRTNETRVITAQAVIVQIGIAPDTQLVSEQIALTPGGWIIVNEQQRTSAELVYAVGDVCRPVCLSVAVAVGHGSIAAKDIAERLRTENE